ncbi:MAG: L-histidine N(alpha)-methyltransferase [Pseudomonadota bacterium]|nr:L-histidine N(alpha)-methyltransferase [Pseudomonadota bacterium]
MSVVLLRAPPDVGVASAVREGLGGERKHLPPWLLYDEEGSRLFERITTLPSYYLTRAERAVLEAHAGEILDAWGTRVDEVVELGAGTATKSQLLLRVLVARQGSTCFVPVDVSAAPVNQARARLARELPTVTVAPMFQQHEAALAALAARPTRRVVLFLGSSIGNLEPNEAVSLARAVRGCIAPGPEGTGGALVLGTDLRKSPELLLPAYDDPEGVSAAFNRNVLARINRELGGRFDLSAVRHVAEWNEPGSRMDMYLESLRDQSVPITALGMTVRLGRGERIHTESSRKYGIEDVDALLGSAGMRRLRTWTDPERRFAVHVAGVI